MPDPAPYRQLPLPFSPGDDRLAAVRAALAVADHAVTAADRRRTTAELGARLARVAGERQRDPAPNPDGRPSSPA